MAFIVNDVTLHSKHGLATVTVHEAQGRQNRVAHVVVPLPTRARLTPAMSRKAALKAAKETFLAAAAAL